MPRFTGSRRASLSLAALAVPLLLHACGGGTEPKATAELVKVSGDGQGTLAGQALAQALVVQVNAVGGGTMSGDSVTFAVASGGGSLGTPSVVTNGGGQAQTTWTLGGTVGSQTVTATVRGAIPATFTATAQPASGPANVVVLSGNNQPGLVGYGVNWRPAVVVTDVNNAPVANATVTFAVATGGGSVTGGTATTNAAGVAQVGKWTLGGSAGVNTLTATVAGAGVLGSPLTFSDTAVAAGYTIQVQYFGPAPSAAVKAAIGAAVTRWQQLIYRPIGPITFTTGQAPAGTCGTGTPAVVGTINNLLILAQFDSIDGPGRILGQAGPCLVRSTNGLTAVGVMEFDTADIANLTASGQLNEVMLHEMGHVIGFGTLWDNPPNDCLQLPSSSGDVLDTYFSCPKARAAFDSLGGTTYTGVSFPPGGNRVPVENCGTSSPAGCGAGTVNGHWREPVFTNELMTGYINNGANPLSIMTVAAQEDLGYTVNYAAADTYVHTFNAPAAGGAAALFLGDDIRSGPILVVDAVGRVVRTLRR